MSRTKSAKKPRSLAHTERPVYSVTELNSTSPSTGELGEFVDEVESGEVNADAADDEDVVKDILYMRGATFTIHLDAPAENSSRNSTKINEEESGAADRVELLRATSQVKRHPPIFPGWLVVLPRARMFERCSVRAIRYAGFQRAASNKRKKGANGKKPGKIPRSTCLCARARMCVR